MLRITFILFMFPGLLFSSGLFAADDLQGRLCNLQSREIALRVSEEVSTDITAEERGEIARIAEEVCLDLAAESLAPATSGITLNDPPVALENDEGRPIQRNPVEEEGLLGDIRIIESEDRVRRPGLKRR